MKSSLVAVEELPEEKIVGGIAPEDYHKLYRLSQTGNLLSNANEGTEVLKVWLKQEFNMNMVNANEGELTIAGEVLECLPLYDYESESNNSDIEIKESDVGVRGIPLKRAQKLLNFVPLSKKNKSPP